MKRIPLTQNQFAIVDDKNYEWLSQYKWLAVWCQSTQSFYAARNKKKNGKSRTIYMHRKILGLVRNDKKLSDHINHNTLDNRESNLRIVNSQQNHFNRKNVKGCNWSKAKKKYAAYIKINSKQIHLGYFLTYKEAHSAYLKAKEKYHKI